MAFEQVKPRVTFLKRAELAHVAEGSSVDVVQGIYAGDDEGKYGTYHIIKKEGTHFGLPSSKLLEDQFSKVHKGEEVLVKYLGKKPTKSGENEYCVFEVLVDREESRPPLPLANDTDLSNSLSDLD